MQNCSSSKPGPKPDPARARLRKDNAEWSDRTFATYWRAWQILFSACGVDVMREALRAAVRPNGSINVSKFARIADRELMIAVDERRIPEDE